MKCEKCRQNEATVFITQMVDGVAEEKHLCEACANKEEKIEFSNGLSFQQFLGGLIKNHKSSQIQRNELKCPKCGMSINDFKRNSKVGCTKCYSTFEDYLVPIVKRIQSNIIHTGKRPKKLDKKLQQKYILEKSQSELKIALMKEDYELAVLLRDQIKVLKEADNGKMV